MDDPKKHVIDTLKEANNILVTVKADPTVDQLSACIALTLVINELGKHGTAVFSGEIPSALDFLEPEKTIEKNTDSLQDFIISLDKAKADKLRYKIEDTVVKIFITPYRTSLSPADLNFEPGDFNVDVVVALGVHNQDDVDTAITEHGRILHDATVLSINTFGGPSEDLGSIAWIDEKASSLSEMIAEIANKLGKDDAIDNQVATALLTGIVAETERFGNSKTTPETMQVASKLLTAGANQELVAAKLADPEPEPEPEPEQVEKYEEPQSEAQSEDNQDNSNGELAEPVEQEQQEDDSDGSLQIEHPITPLSAFAQENTDFEIPQPEENVAEEPQTEAQPEMQPVLDAQQEQPEQPVQEQANQDAGIPPVFDPSQLMPEGQPSNETENADSPGEPTSFPQPPLVTEATAAAPEQSIEQPAPEATPEPEPAVAEEAVEQAEEEAALNYLKDRRVDYHPRAVIEPLHDGEKPMIEPLHHEGALPDEAEAPTPSEDGKFALTPPTLGGTLTANLPNERKANSLEKEAIRHESHAPILSHRAPHARLDAPAHKPEAASDDGLMSVLPQAPTPTLAELEKQVQDRREAAKPVVRHDEPVQAASLITPLIDHKNNTKVAAPTVELPKPAPDAMTTPPPPVPPPMPTPVGQ